MRTVREVHEFELIRIGDAGGWWPKVVYDVRRVGEDEWRMTAVFPNNDITRELRSAIFKKFGITNPIEIEFNQHRFIWQVRTVINITPNKEANA